MYFQSKNKLSIPSRRQPMSFPKSKEPTLAIVADYTFNLLKDIKSGKQIEPQEWDYLIRAPFEYLQEILAIVGFCFNPIKNLGHFEGYRETSELVWQHQRALRAMQAMDLITKDEPVEKYRITMRKAITLFMLLSLKMKKDKRFPSGKMCREVFDQYLFFLYHLHGSICGYHRRKL